MSAAIARAYGHTVEEEKKFVESLSKGQVATQGISSINNFPVEITFKDYKYSFQVNKISPDSYKLTLGDQVRSRR